MTIIYRLGLCIFLTLWMPFRPSAQDAQLDSVKALVEAYEFKDTTRVNLLLDLTRYYASGDITQNPPLFEEALEISKRLNYAKGIGSALNVQCKHFIITGALDRALPIALQAKQVFDSLNYKTGQIGTNNNLARIYNVNGEFNKSLEMHLENVHLVMEQPDSPDKAGMYFYVAKTYESLMDFDSAEVYYQKALDISSTCGFQTGIAIAEGSLGGIYNKLGRFDQAIKYLNRTLAFSEAYGHTTNIAASCFTLADIYFRKGDFQQALNYINRSIQVYEELGTNRMLKDSYLAQTQYKKALNDFRGALQSLKLHVDFKDSVFSENKMKVIEELQAKYETEKKEAEIISLSQRSQIQDLQLQKQRYGLFGLGVLIMLVIGSAFLLYRQRQLKQRQEITTLELAETKKRLAVEQQYRASELKALRSQMNPHFVFNALNSIQEYIMLNEKRLAGKYLGKFADLMRTYLDQSQKKSVTVQAEVDALKLYLELEKLRFEDSLEYQIHVAEDLDPDDIQLPALLVQPFVENALKHGLLHKQGERKLSVSFIREDDVLICKVKDNGIGRKASEELNKNRNPNHKSYATGAIQERIELINYSMSEPVRFETVDVTNQQGEVSGTEVRLFIPMVGFAEFEA
jgi:tetratricopeptide (TPR) repeat protein/two-component sensor histidine kinase